MNETSAIFWNQYNIIKSQHSGSHRNYFLITTNSMIKKSGEMVMGAGIAKSACNIIPSLAKDVYTLLSVREPLMVRNPYKLQDYNLVLLPEHSIGCLQTKRDWKDPSPIELVEQSLLMLNIVALSMPGVYFHMPRPGCGIGKLNWETQVKPLCQKLPNNVFIYK